MFRYYGQFCGLARAAVLTADDPVADLFALGMAYRAHAVDSPQLYRLMFGLSAPLPRRGTRRNLLAAATTPISPRGQTAFQPLGINLASAWAYWVGLRRSRSRRKEIFPGFQLTVRTLRSDDTALAN